MDHGARVDLELAVYETADVESSSEDESSAVPTSENIVDAVVPRDVALEAFVNAPRRIDDTVPLRVGRIRREIEQLRSDGAKVQASELLTELESLTKRDRPPAARQVAAPPERHEFESSSQFAAMESRLAALETRLGVAVRSRQRPESLAKSVAQLRQTVELLASNPEGVAKILETVKESPLMISGGVKSTSDSRLDALYHRLGALDEAISLLPQVTSRLQALRYVHSEVLNQHTQLKDVQGVIESMQADLSSWRATLDALEPRIAEYIRVSHRNIEKLRH